MMRFEIYLFQKKTQDPNMYQQAIEEYLKRLSAYAKVSVFYQKNQKKLERVMSQPGKHFYVTPGRDSKKSEEFAEMISDLSVAGESKVHFYIGDFDSYQMEKFHVSSFCQNGSLTSVILLEQIYRAYRILNCQPYHK